MQIFISIITTLLVLTALIVVHEFGHYMAAKKNGIKVTGFSIGFGPKIFKWHRNETEFAIRPIFVGGYVKFPDDIESEPKPGDLRAAPLKSRFLTIVFGPVMNIVFAIILVTILLISTGGYTLYVGGVIPDSPAEKAGIREGDRLLKLDGINLQLDLDFVELQNVEKGEYSQIVVERNGERFDLEVPYQQTEQGKMIGITFNSDQDIQHTSFNFFQALGLSFKWIGLQMKAILNALGDVFTGHTENLSGIVGTTQVVGEVATNPIYGWETMITLIAIISINLAIVNLLPLPALDGGKIVIYAIEGIRKKPVSETVEGALNLIGFIFLIGLSVFLVFQDVSRLTL